MGTINRLARRSPVVPPNTQWSAIVVPMLWLAACPEDHNEFMDALIAAASNVPSGLAGLWGNGSQSISSAFHQLQRYLHERGITTAEALQEAIAQDEPRIRAWIHQDSRYRNRRPRTAHFNVPPGSYLHDYVQE